MFLFIFISIISSIVCYLDQQNFLWLLHWLKIRFFRYISEENGNITLERYIRLCVHSSILYISQDTEATWVSISQWMQIKTWCRDFPGGWVVKTVFSRVGNIGSIFGWGTKIPHESWTKKKTRCDVYVHIHTPSGILAIKMSETLSFAVAWMDLEGIMLSGKSQTEREIWYVLAYMWNLKNKANE